MGGLLKQSTAVTVKMGPFKDATDGNTNETALTIQKADVRLSKNGGNIAAASADQGASDAGAAHDELGVYDISFDTTDTNTLGRLRADIQESGALAVWDEWMVVPGWYYDLYISGLGIEAGTAQAGANGSITLRAGATASAALVNGQTVHILGGTGAGQSRAITDYNGTTKVATIEPVWVTNPDSTSVYWLSPTPPAADTTVPLVKVSGTIQTLDALDTQQDAQHATTQAAITDNIGANGAALTSIPWNAAWDAEVQSEVADALAVYDPPTKAELDTAQAAVTPADGALSLAKFDATVQALLKGDIDITLDGAGNYTIKTKDGVTTLASGTYTVNADNTVTLNAA